MGAGVVRRRPLQNRASPRPLPIVLLRVVTSQSKIPQIHRQQSLPLTRTFVIAATNQKRLYKQQPMLQRNQLPADAGSLQIRHQRKSKRQMRTMPPIVRLEGAG
jgi:hypothetical protein